MTKVILTAVAAMAIAITGCSDDGIDRSKPVSPQLDVIEPAEFRYIARNVYEALWTGSCEDGPVLRRALLLADDKAETWFLEMQLMRRHASRHLAVARTDVEYRRDTGELGCWLDSDPDFAEMHSEMAESTAQRGLALLKRKASSLPPLTLASSEPAHSAAFRSRVRVVVESLLPLCPIISAASNDEVLKPARAALMEFRSAIRDTPFAANFDIAQADAKYERHLTVAECWPEGDEQASDVSLNALKETKKALSELTAMMKA